MELSWYCNGYGIMCIMVLLVGSFYFFFVFLFLFVSFLLLNWVCWIIPKNPSSHLMWVDDTHCFWCLSSLCIPFVSVVHKVAKILCSFGHKRNNMWFVSCVRFLMRFLLNNNVLLFWHVLVLVVLCVYYLFCCVFCLW